MKIIYICFAVFFTSVAILAGCSIAIGYHQSNTPVQVTVLECYREDAKYTCDLQRTQSVVVSVGLERHKWNELKAHEGQKVNYTFKRAGGDIAVDLFMCFIATIIAIGFWSTMFMKPKDLEGDFG